MSTVWLRWVSIMHVIGSDNAVIDACYILQDARTAVYRESRDMLTCRRLSRAMDYLLAQVQATVSIALATEPTLPVVQSLPAEHPHSPGIEPGSHTGL